MPDAAARRLRVIPDAMVLAAGLSSRKEPASFSRRVVEAIFDDVIEVVLTETLLVEAREVLVDAGFRGQMPEVLADGLLEALRVAASEVIDDSVIVAPRRCHDPDDDYLVDAALATGSMLVSRDDRADFASVPGLDSGRPGTALRRAGLLED